LFNYTKSKSKLELLLDMQTETISLFAYILTDIIVGAETFELLDPKTNKRYT